MHGLLDEPPLFAQLTLPEQGRMRLRRPPRLALHFAELAIAEREQRHGLPVTTAARALRDAAKSLRDRRRLQIALRRALERDLVDLRTASDWLERFRA